MEHPELRKQCQWNKSQKPEEQTVCVTCLLGVKPMFKQGCPVLAQAIKIKELRKRIGE